jgi:hypothetical protein
VERDGGSFVARAAELLRTLATAAAAVRLYPPTSPLRLQAIERFVQAAHILTSSRGPIQYLVDRTRFVVMEIAVGESQPQVSALAESLHALQVGQLIIAPGISADETALFLDILGREAKAVRASGGARSALLESGVENIAVVEVSLRTSTEEGMLGLDLTQAPLEEIADQIVPAMEAWTASAAEGQGLDVAAEAIGRLEPAARDLAMQRCAEALLRLDEATRVRVLQQALATDAGGAPMAGMLDIVARMSPPALARLLRLAAEAATQPPGALAGLIELPPQAAAELARLLEPPAVSGRDGDVSERTDTSGILSEVVADAEADVEHIRTLVISASPREKARRGLGTTVHIAVAHPDAVSVRAVIDALGPAVATGAYDEVARAAELLGGLAGDPSLSAIVQESRGVLGSPDLLRDCVLRLADDPDARGPRALFDRAGHAGAEALALVYVESDDATRIALTPLARSLIEPIALTAGKLIRSRDTTTALGAVDLLRALASRRLLPTCAHGLEHPDPVVREAAAAAIADMPGPESRRILQDALAHRNIAVRLAAVRGIGRARRTDALDSLLEIIGSSGRGDRNQDLKREAFRSIEMLGSDQAVPVLEKLAKRSAGIGKRRRENRDLARTTLAALKRTAG